MFRRGPAVGHQQAVRLALDHFAEYGSASAAALVLGPRVDLDPETLRRWIVRALAGAPVGRRWWRRGH